MKITCGTVKRKIGANELTIKTLFKTVGSRDIVMGREIRLNSQDSKDSWKFITKEWSNEVSGWKITKRKHQG